LKMAVVAPMPTPSVRIATSAKRGDLRRDRAPSRTSRRNSRGQRSRPDRGTSFAWGRLWLRPRGRERLDPGRRDRHRERPAAEAEGAAVGAVDGGLDAAGVAGSDD